MLKNVFIDPVTLTFDLSIRKPRHFEYVQGHSLCSLNTLGSFVYELCCGQTNGQTDKQTDSTIRLTPPDVVAVGNNYSTRQPAQVQVSDTRQSLQVAGV